MRDYGKLYTSFWTSETTRSLSEDGRTLACYLLTGPHTNMIGVFRVPDGYVSEDLQWGFERVSKGFRNLYDKGFATRYDSTKWVVIHKFLEWNELENPNQLKSAIKLLEQAPNSIREIPLIANVLTPIYERFKDKIPEDFYNRLQTLSKPFLNQEQEQEQEQEQDTHTQHVRACEAEITTLPTSNAIPPFGDLIALFAEYGFGHHEVTAPKVVEMIRQWREDGVTEQTIREGVEAGNCVIRKERNADRPDTPFFYAKYVKFAHDASFTPAGIYAEGAKRVLAFLSKKAGKNFEPVPELLRPISAILSKGNTEAECRQVIAIKWREWEDRPEMHANMKPTTLFKPEKFYEYKAQILTEDQLQEASA